MGMLYKECKKCKGCMGVFGQYVGFIKCITCQLWIQEDENPMFAKHKVKCSNCEWTVSFDAMGTTEARCVKCDKLMDEIK